MPEIDGPPKVVAVGIVNVTIADVAIQLQGRNLVEPCAICAPFFSGHRLERQCVSDFISNLFRAVCEELRHTFCRILSGT